MNSLFNIHSILFCTSTLMIRSGFSIMATHYKCRGGTYPRSKVERFPVPDGKVLWETPYPEYNPPSYTSPGVYGKPWADPDIAAFPVPPKWNALDGKVNRESHLGDYQIIDGYPRNPIGRTGIVGRGVLGRWGPNHAADPVVTRWKRDSDGKIVLNNNIPILQFVAIKRRDTGEWALPGGMVDPGEKISATACREFQEEAMNSLDMSEDQKEMWQMKFRQFFAGGEEVFKGYIDDPRNTDNAWMESVAFNFHDDDGKTVGQFKLHAGDDAVGVRWVDAEPNINLYASHKDIVMKVLQLRLNVNKN